ncbi:MAG: hypothetical protein WA061_04675 [Microgenomates group bacterium]
MSKSKKPSQLIEKEKILYVEVEQLRYRLYLHDTSIIFEFFSAFYFAFQDIKGLFVKKAAQSETHFLQSLKRKKSLLQILEKTPYAWIIFLARRIKNSLSFRGSKRPRNPVSTSKRKTKSYLIFGTTYATDFQSRSVQIARKLAEKNKVIYVEGVFDEGIKPGSRIIEESEMFTAIRLTARQMFHLNYQKPSTEELSFIKKSLQKFITIHYPLVTSHINVFKYIHHPFWKYVLSLKKNSFLFDLADNFEKGSHASKHIVQAEQDLIKNALKITVPKLPKKKSSRFVLLKNGVNWNHFKDASQTIQTCDVGLCWIKKPVIGFIGSIDERTDEALIGTIASAFPTASVVLVGNTDYRPIIKVAEQHANIFPVGKQPYNKLPLMLQSFDILIAPYDLPELPLYLASGKPIICSAKHTSGVGLGSTMYTSKTSTDWVLAIQEALKESKRSRKKYQRILLAKKLNWKIPHAITN